MLSLLITLLFFISLYVSLSVFFSNLISIDIFNTSTICFVQLCVRVCHDIVIKMNCLQNIDDNHVIPLKILTVDGESSDNYSLFLNDIKQNERCVK